MSYQDTKYDRYVKYDSDCVISFPPDPITSPTSTSLFKLTLSAIHSRLPTLSARVAAWAGCKVKLAVKGLEGRHFYSRTNFKLKRDAALAEWRQLLSA